MYSCLIILWSIFWRRNNYNDSHFKNTNFVKMLLILWVLEVVCLGGALLAFVPPLFLCSGVWHKNRVDLIVIEKTSTVCATWKKKCRLENRLYKIMRLNGGSLGWWLNSLFQWLIYCWISCDWECTERWFQACVFRNCTKLSNLDISQPKNVPQGKIIGEGTCLCMLCSTSATSLFIGCGHVSSLIQPQELLDMQGWVVKTGMKLEIQFCSS